MNALKAAQKAREKGGLALFLCPSRPGELRLTPATCARSHADAQTAQDESKVRLWHCQNCEVGAANAAALGVMRQNKRVRAPANKGSGKALPDSLARTLEFVRIRGRCTSPDAAKHFGLHRDTIASRLLVLERMGLVRRIAGASKTLIWTAA